MTTVTRIDLLRHGEAQGGTRFRGSTDDPLTDIGWEQMKTATQGSSRWDRVISSPLERCAAFARAFTEHQSLPLTFDERIKEIHFGFWEGRTAAELDAKDPKALARFWNDPNEYPPPDGERLSDFHARVQDAWNCIIHRHAGQRILIITHGGVIRSLLCDAQQRPISKLLEIEVKYGSLHTLKFSIDAQDMPITELIGEP